jgi:diguanylate cyclase (GGDEF)-like protein
MLRRDASGNGSPPPPPAGFFQALLDSLPAVLMVLDSGGTIRYVAGQIARLGKRTHSELVGCNAGELMATPGDQALVKELLASTARRPPGEMIGPVRLSYLDVDGTVRLSAAWAVNRSSDSGTNGIIVLLLPESAYDYFDEVVGAMTKDVDVEDLLAALAAALGLPPVGRGCYFLRPAGDDRGIVRCPEAAAAPGPPTPGPWDEIWAGAESVECENLSQLSSGLREAAKEVGLVSVACFAVRGNDEGRADACLVTWSREEGRLNAFAGAAIQRAVLIASLAISYRSARATPSEAGLRDSLTGLSNRRNFFQALEAAVAAGEQPALLYIDLDGFRHVNDRMGHLAGDAVLRVSARRLASIMRPTDELARLGGDEFAVLCTGSPTPEQMAMIAERVVEQLSRPLSVGDGETVDVGASIGIAHGFPVGTPVDTIIGRADQALHEARNLGSGRFAFATLE